VRKFFEQHAESRFSSWETNPIEAKTINRTGFKRQEGDEIRFYVLPEIFKSEICAGLDYSFVARVCVAHGWIEMDKEGNPTRAERLPGNSKKGTTRCYKFTSKVIEN
jgi:putative DNA primase/helicase